MCGIVGYIGDKEAQNILLEGLRRLEYRGYDSAGLAIYNEDRIHIYKQASRIDQLTNHLIDHQMLGKLGIGHTRWATHGSPSDSNSHPHVGGNDTLALVHNGVIENYQSIRTRLEKDGYIFQSETDSEAVAHLIASCYQKLKEQEPQTTDPKTLIFAALEEAVHSLKGTYGLAIVFRDHPNIIAAARLGSPLVVGIGKGEHFIASDASALAGLTQEVVYLQDNEIALLTTDEMFLMHRDRGRVQPNVMTLNLTNGDLSKGDYEHYMLKEIFEQPESIANAMRGRLNIDEASSHFGGLNLTPQQLRNINRIIFTACGTSWHAAMVGEYLIEEFARIPVEVEYASEFRYRNPPMDPSTLVFAITQSGETADTLAALRESKRKGHASLSICNVVGSSIAREADGGMYLYAGPEIGVASTKAFTSQVTVLILLALYLGRMNHLSYLSGCQMIEDLKKIPDLVRRALECNEAIKQVAEKYADVKNVLYLGRHYNFPVALEGALKLKEISYIHAEGYPAAEMKHGPIALVDKHTPSVFLITRSVVYDKVMSNLEEIKARGGPVIAIACEGDTEVKKKADDVIYVPDVPDHLQPLITSIPMQLLAYHIAVIRGCDVDKPRNLAKSVTVE